MKVALHVQAPHFGNWLKTAASGTPPPVECSKHRSLKFQASTPPLAAVIPRTFLPEPAPRVSTLSPGKITNRRFLQIHRPALRIGRHCGLVPFDEHVNHSRRIACSGPHRASDAKLLLKAEWDKIEAWLKANPDVREFNATGNTGNY